MTDVIIIGYKLTRTHCCGWMFAGVAPSEVAQAIKNELDMDEVLSVSERGEIVIEPYETTQYQIDALPEFQGW